MTRHCAILVAAVVAVSATSLAAQTRAAKADSLPLRYMRIRAEPTDSCVAVLNISGTMNIQVAVTPGELQQWIDSARAIAAIPAVRGRSGRSRVEYHFMPLRIGITRTITSRFDAFEFVISSHGIPIVASEIPRIARLLDSAAVTTRRLSAGNTQRPPCSTAG